MPHWTSERPPRADVHAQAAQQRHHCCSEPFSSRAALVEHKPDWNNDAVATRKPQRADSEPRATHGGRVSRLQGKRASSTRKVRLMYRSGARASIGLAWGCSKVLVGDLPALAMCGSPLLTETPSQGIGQYFCHDLNTAGSRYRQYRVGQRAVFSAQLCAHAYDTSSSRRRVFRSLWHRRCADDMTTVGPPMWATASRRLATTKSSTDDRFVLRLNSPSGKSIGKLSADKQSRRQAHACSNA